MKKSLHTLALIYLLQTCSLFGQTDIAIYLSKSNEVKNSEVLTRVFDGTISAFMKCGKTVRNNTEWYSLANTATEAIAMESEVETILKAFAKIGEMPLKDQNRLNLLSNKARFIVLLSISIHPENINNKYELTILVFDRESINYTIAPGHIYFNKEQIVNQGSIEQKISVYLANNKFCQVEPENGHEKAKSKGFFVVIDPKIPYTRPFMASDLDIDEFKTVLKNGEIQQLINSRTVTIYVESGDELIFRGTKGKVVRWTYRSSRPRVSVK